MKGFVAFLTGLLFALGLGIGGMTQPHIVKGFLDIFGNWNWQLMGVMIGAIGVHAMAYRFIIKRPSPILDESFYLPKENQITARLIGGAVLFGLGWGWVGICPGPGIVSLASGKLEFFYFVISMIAGMRLFQLVERKNTVPSSKFPLYPPT